MQIIITQMSEQTLNDQATLLAEYQEFYKVKPNHSHNLRFLRSFLNRDDGKFFIAKNGEEIIGYVCLYFSYSSISATRIAILNDLYVRKEFRNNGVGAQLIDFAINHASMMDIKQVRWFTRTHNIDAQKLYKKYNATKTDWLHYDLKLEEI